MSPACIAYRRSGNKFLEIANPQVAQRLLSRQVHLLQPARLNRLVPMIFPTRRETIGAHLDYYLAIWQSEWATDLILQDHTVAQRHMETLLRHALITGTSDRVLRYLARPITKEGRPHANDHNQITTRVATYHDGIRIRHWAGSNSAKVYNEQNNIRFEATINDPSAFQVMRRAQGEDRSQPKRKLPMRKGVADISHRAAVGQGINNRVMGHLAGCSEATPLADLLAPYTRTFTKAGRRIRAIEPMGKDRQLPPTAPRHR